MELWGFIYIELLKAVGYLWCRDTLLRLNFIKDILFLFDTTLLSIDVFHWISNRYAHIRWSLLVYFGFLETWLLPLKILPLIIFLLNTANRLLTRNQWLVLIFIKILLLNLILILMCEYLWLIPYFYLLIIITYLLVVYLKLNGWFVPFIVVKKLLFELINHEAVINGLILFII